jgi:hypothetical protein
MPNVNSPEWQTLFGETPFQFSMTDEESLALDDEVRAATDLHNNAMTMDQHDHIMAAQPRAIPSSTPPALQPLPVLPSPLPSTLLTLVHYLLLYRLPCLLQPIRILNQV